MPSVGVPKEIKPREKRVGLTPEAVKSLSRDGTPIFVEAGAGLGSGFRNEDYARSGAVILPDAASLYRCAAIIQKVKEPQPAEFSLLGRGQILFCFLHLASPANCELVRALLKSQVTAIGYETLERAGKTPLLAPMSEIAGGLAAAYAGFFRSLDLVREGCVVYPADFQTRLEAVAGLYPRPPEFAAGRAVVFGAGVAGTKALEFLLAMKGDVSVVEKNPETRDRLREKFQTQYPALKIFSPEDLPAEILEASRVMIGCVHAAGKRAAKVMEDAALQAASRARKKVIVDVSIDQGGNFPEARPTTYDDPLTVDSFGNLRFSVANIPSLCGAGASEALARAALPYTAALARDPASAFREFPELEGAVNVRAGEVLNPSVRAAHQL